jgi:hypothetical protein
MPQFECPMCRHRFAFDHSKPAVRCPGCDEPIAVEKQAERIEADAQPDTSEFGKQYVVLVRKTSIYHAYRLDHDLALLHVTTATNAVAIPDLLKWTTENGERRMRQLIVFKVLLPFIIVILGAISLGWFFRSFMSEKDLKEIDNSIAAIYAGGFLVAVVLAGFFNYLYQTRVPTVPRSSSTTRRHERVRAVRYSRR